MVSSYKTLANARSSSSNSNSKGASSSSSSSTSISAISVSKRKLQALYSEDLPRPLTAVCTRPIPNSYWATPLLLACEYPWSPKNPNKPKLDALLRAGVRTFIDLTECGELIPYTSILDQRCALLGIDPNEIEYHRFAIRDRCLPESASLMYDVLDTLRDNAERGRVSAVHCRGGIGRTGMVIGCWLVESGVARDGAEALAIIAREWKSVEKCKRYPHSPETGPQFEFVAKFHPSPKMQNLQLEVA
ncbi:dual specificity protein phosphatase [Pholiota conissans]|uniref:Dual specificity protein phosphatase n=1 Tax=Pholiota conissans TaxID=109636 RepID=A0A9P5ZAL7_9AGAR|nr:dual specificity protein phosphatase [Pholiota conissans]